MLFDSHAHLDSQAFDRDRDKVINNLKKDGIEFVVIPGTSIMTSTKAIALANKYSNLYATVGIHPCNTEDMDADTIEVLKQLGKSKKVVAIGECGLDYHHHYSPVEVQKKWFVEQILVARDLKLPLSIHDREANIDTYNTLKAEKADTVGGVLHCYSGDAALARKYVEMGFYLSIAGPVTYKSAGKLREVAKEIPLEYLLIETDSPCLTPSNAGRKRNEPIYVRYVASMIAELKGIAFEKVAEKTNENARRLFRI